MSLGRVQNSYVQKEHSSSLVRWQYNSFSILISSLNMISGKAPEKPTFKKVFNSKASDKLFCTGFKDKHNPGLQKTVDIKKAKKPLNDYLTIIFKTDDNHGIKDVLAQVKALRQRTGQCDYIFYPSLDKKNVWYYVFPVDAVLNANQYRELVKSLLRSVAVKGIVDRIASEDPLTSVPLVTDDYKKRLSEIKFQSNQTSYSVDRGFLLVTLDPVKKPAPKPKPKTPEEKQAAEAKKKHDKKSISLYQNMIAAANYLVSPNNPSQYGRKLFTSRVNPDKVEQYRKTLQKVEQDRVAFVDKFPNTKDPSYPKKTANKLTNKIKVARKIYEKNSKDLYNRDRIIQSIASANINGAISDATAKKIMAAFDSVDTRHKAYYYHQFKLDCSDLKASPNKRGLSEPISEALRLYQRATDSGSISLQFQEILGKNYKADPKAPLSDAFNEIKLIYPPAILKSSTQGNSSNVVIFNPLDGYWSHDSDLFSELLHAIKPTVDRKDVRDFVDALGADAAMRHRYIEPYHGNRYLLYNNGVYDTAQPDNPKTGLPDKLIPLNSNLVHDLHFTERAYHKINLVVDPPLPQYDALSNKSGQPNAMWTPLRVLNGYSNFDKHIRSYFLFCLSLGLFSTHNFSVSLDIQGPSGSGKTMLSTIFETMYGPSRVNMAPFANLNGRFVFTSYKDDTAIIWFDEANTDSKPLGSRGISTYDALNDDQARFEVKNKGDHIIDNPPMVFIDGTDFLKTSNPDVGPYRRTLVMKLPNDLTESKKKTFYTNDFKSLLSKMDVVEWLNWKMILAYREKTSVSDRCHDLKFNMTNKSIRRVVPKKAMDWRENLRNHDNNITEWFTEVLQPCLNPTIDDPDPKRDISRVQKAFMYHLFQNHMITNYNQHISDRDGNSVSKFWDAFKEIAAENNWRIIRIKAGSQPRARSRMKIRKLTSTHIDWDQYKKVEALPADYDKAQTIRHQPFGFLTAWYYIEKVPAETGSDGDDDSNKD